MTSTFRPEPTSTQAVSSTQLPATIALHPDDLQEVREAELSTRALDPDELRGAIIANRYQLLERQRPGTHGVVYGGAHIELGRAVTIELVDNGDRGARAASEAASAARLSHPHCGAVLDIGTHGTRTFVVRERLTGPSLDQLLCTERMSVRRAIGIMRQVLAALAHAHELGIVHGDLSASNIIVEQKSGIGDDVKVIGFGATNADAEDDLHACGALLSVMIGHHEHVPGPLAEVVRRALTRSAPDRFRSACEVAAALDAAAAQLVRRAARPSPPPAPPNTSAADSDIEHPSAAERRSAPIRGRIIAVALVASIGVTAVAMLRRSNGEPASPAPATQSQVAIVATEPPAAPTPDPVASIVSRAQELVDRGDRNGALDLLIASRVTYPDDARLPRLAGAIYFEKLWWADGVKQLRAAFELDPSMRQDPEIAAIAVEGFTTTPSYHPLLGRFVREDIGAAAIANLERVAREHRNPAVRARAVAEVRRIAAH